MPPHAATHAKLSARCALLVCCALLGIGVLCPSRAVGEADTTTQAPAVDPGPSQQEQAVDPVASPEAVIAPQAVVEQSKVKVQTLAEADAQAVQSGTKPQDVLVPGNAALQTTASKREEAKRDCQDKRLPTSPMLAVGGVVASEDGGPWGALLLVVAAAAAVVLCAAVVMRLRAPTGPPAAEHRLERMSTVIAIVTGVVGLVVTFVPGVAGSERPAQEATMTVREVHPRITRLEYALRRHASRKGISTTDLHEVGNVIWLQIDLRGYAKRHPVLQYGLYQYRGEVLLPNTAKEVLLPVQDADFQTAFVPIWVGYPSRDLFQAQFRLLEHGQVRQMAKTGRMRGSTVRYVCTG
jgi:hypothetical protein